MWRADKPGFADDLSSGPSGAALLPRRAEYIVADHRIDITGLPTHDTDEAVDNVALTFRGDRKLDAKDRLILDRIQRAFPLVSDPFGVIGGALKLDAGEVMERVKGLKEQGLVRQISAIFNTGALGYRSSLVAMAVPEKRLRETVEVINRYPGVSHNYLRPCPYNVWYTIAVPPEESLESKVAGLSRDAGGWPTLVLPAIKKYKLAVVLDVLDEGEGEPLQETTGPASLEASGAFHATGENVSIVKCVQEDLPVVPSPFAEWAGQLGMFEEALLGCLSKWLQQGIMRRFAAILNHRQAGFGANGMVVWRCLQERLDEAGRILAGCHEVSHCYHRPSLPEWPYNLYAMVHGRTMDECRNIAQRLASAIRNQDFQVLVSTAEFKKIRLKLFWD